MKRLLLCILALFVELSAFCQQTHHTGWPEYDAMIRKGNKQETAGLIMLFTGGAAFGVTFLTTYGEPLNSPYPAGAVQLRRHQARAAYLVSSAVALGGLALCIASDKTKEHARQLRFAIKMDQVSTLPAYTVSSSARPCLSIKMRL